jgi:hypothetical protein
VPSGALAYLPFPSIAAEEQFVKLVNYVPHGFLIG